MDRFDPQGGTDDEETEYMRELLRQFGIPVPEREQENERQFRRRQRDPREQRGQRRGDNDEAEEKDEDEAAGPGRKTGVGSGVIISKDGYILTNNHVVEKSDKLEISVGNTGKSYPAKIIGTDKLTDVALLKIEGGDFPTAVLGDSDKIRVGDIVLAAGSPMELSQSVSQGIVSALGRTGMNIVHGSGRTGGVGFENFIQTDAAINPGNSGGPLTDAMGRVIGINTAIYSRSGMSAGIGFTIPIKMAMRIAEDLVDDGQVRRGFLGVSMTNISEEAARSMGLESGGGVNVGKVTENSAAEAAGIEAGDIIISANGQRTETGSDLRSIVGTATEGTIMPIEIIRDGQRRTLNVTLKGTTDEELASGRAPENVEKQPAAKKEAPIPGKIISGLTCTEITPALRDRYDIPQDITGAVVVNVEANSDAARAGVEEGDVIQQINQKPVRSMAEAMQNRPSGRVIMLKINRAGEKISTIVGQ
jgi:serine protease Do